MMMSQCLGKHLHITAEQREEKPLKVSSGAPSGSIKEQQYGCSSSLNKQESKLFSPFDFKGTIKPKMPTPTAQNERFQKLKLSHLVLGCVHPSSSYVPGRTWAKVSDHFGFNHLFDNDGMITDSRAGCSFAAYK